jgi:fructose-1,6-bisphosphatase/inositol monophosphatase family enzyme
MYAVSIGVVSLAGEQPQVVAGVIYNPVSIWCSDALKLFSTLIPSYS